MNTKQLRQKILNLAIRGKLVPQDPNDEPASVLLERVCYEKERLIKAGKIKRDKGNYGIDKTHYEQLPDGWAWTTLGAYLDVRDGTHDTPKYVENGVPLITSKNLCNGMIDFDNVKLISIDDHKIISLRSQVDDEDILFAMIGSIGNPVLVRKMSDFSIKNVALFKKILESINMSYVRYYLEYVQDKMKITAKGGLQPFVPLNMLRTYQICIPPLAEQRRIVAAIESAFSVIDEIERNKTDLQAAVAAAKSKILDLAIRGKLVPQDPDDESAGVLLERIQEKKERLEKEGAIKRTKSLSPILDDELPFHIPERWKWSRLGNIAFYKKGPFGSSITKSMFVPDSETVIKVYEQKNAIGKDHTLGTYYINSEKFNELQGFEVFPNDIIVSCAGTIGEAYVMPVSMRKGIINQALMRVMLYEIGMTDFYLLYFDFMLKNTAQDDSKGTAMKNIPPFDILKQYLIPIPPLAEQQRIVSAIEAAFKQLDRIAGILI